MNYFLSGAILAEALAIGLFFLKFWRKSGDRIFLIFAVAFWIFAVERVALVATSASSEDQSGIYALRLLAFILITAGIVDKNKRTR